jgi:hypothetical protein
MADASDNNELETRPLPEQAVMQGGVEKRKQR